jgi:DNA-binding GntR family transcriptional regulator
VRHVSRYSAQLLHDQLALIIAEEIDAGRLAVGDWLPSEAALMRDQDLARGTVRRALQIVAGMGRIQAIKGRGYFVVR